MEKLKERIASFRNALKTIQEILVEKDSVIVRDAAIQRFEYTVEAMWKALKFFLLEFEGIEAQTPKSCIRSAMLAGILDARNTEVALKMIDDRNVTSHTYIEDVANGIYSRIPEYASLMSKVLLYLEQKMSAN